MNNRKAIVLGLSVFVPLLVILQGYYYHWRNEENGKKTDHLFTALESMNALEEAFVSDYYGLKLNECLDVKRRRRFQRKSFFYRLIESDLETYSYKVYDNKDSLQEEFELNLYYNYVDNMERSSIRHYLKKDSSGWTLK